MEVMKRFGLLKCMAAVLCCVFAMALVSCGDDDDDKAPSLSISPSNVSMIVGGSSSVSIGGGTAPYTIGSTNEAIANLEVNKNKISITGLEAGAAIVSVSDKNNLYGRFMLVVVDREDWLQFNEQEVTVEKEQTYRVAVQNGTGSYTAVAADATVAEVSMANYVVMIRGLKAGTTTVTVKDKLDRSGTISVTVKEKEAES